MTEKAKNKGDFSSRASVTAPPQRSFSRLDLYAGLCLLTLLAIPTLALISVSTRIRLSLVHANLFLLI